MVIGSSLDSHNSAWKKYAFDTRNSTYGSKPKGTLQGEQGSKLQGLGVWYTSNSEYGQHQQQRILKRNAAPANLIGGGPASQSSQFPGNYTRSGSQPENLLSGKNSWRKKSGGSGNKQVHKLPPLSHVPKTPAKVTEKELPNIDQTDYVISQKRPLATWPFPKSTISHGIPHIGGRAFPLHTGPAKRFMRHEMGRFWNNMQSIGEGKEHKTKPEVGSLEPDILTLPDRHPVQDYPDLLQTEEDNVQEERRNTSSEMFSHSIPSTSSSGSMSLPSTGGRGSNDSRTPGGGQSSLAPH